ncbi:MAG: hypothetical protein ACR2GT_04245, partial [Gaiellaceae bacterium]
MTKGTVDKPQLGLRRIIERPRLTRLLDESPARIKMLVAPAGYGKTTLARQWLKLHHRYGCFGLTAAAADPAELIAQLGAIAAVIDPGCDERVRERLSYTADPESEWPLLLDILLEDLASADPRAWMCIDDYQALGAARTGEQIIETFASQVPFGILLVGRERPSWVTTRMILYGHISEIGRSALAMTPEEARAAFDTNEDFMPGLVHLADGWPAVLAIAVSSQPIAEIPEDVTLLPEHLYLFFAEELYSQIDLRTALGLTAIALAGCDDLDGIRIVVEEADEVVRRGIAAGWLTARGASRVEFHPLLKSFLCQKLEADHRDAFRQTCRDVCAALTRHHRWDDAFRLIKTFSLTDLILPLLEVSWQEILHVGRISTLREWLDYASSCDRKAPEAALAQAEIFFRSGKFYESERAALEVARSPEARDAYAEALIAAGRAAHAASREQRALQYFKEARDVAHTSSGRIAAALGELSAAIDLELPETMSLLAELREITQPQSDDIEIALTGRAIAIAARFGLPQDLDHARNAYRLLPALPDPI